MGMVSEVTEQCPSCGRVKVICLECHWCAMETIGLARFDESLDGVDRCGKFLEQLSALMKEHHVKVNGVIRDLQQVDFTHEDPENGWIVDMQDVQTLTDGKSR